jgi:hypothetical protein
MTEKRKFNPLFPTLFMGAGGRPTYFKMAKNVKSLIIFARDCRQWCKTETIIRGGALKGGGGVSNSSISVF